MSGDRDAAELSRVVEALNRRYLREHPSSAARRIEELPLDDAVDELSTQSAPALIPVWPALSADRGGELLGRLSRPLARDLLAGLLPTEAVRFLGAMDDAEREALLAAIDAPVADPLRELMIYPEDAAGRLMQTRVVAFRGEVSASRALERLRENHVRVAQHVFVVDEQQRVIGQVPIQDLALSAASTKLAQISRPILATVHPMDPREDVVEKAEQYRLGDLPVVDLDGRLIGVIQSQEVLAAMQHEAVADIGTMVGVSPRERALSRPWFAVRQRLPWLQINLLTAFLAASVVGLFEQTIAQFTALAVLLPVVAGQSGNAGAQALAVTMRGLTLREITVSQWLSVALKEIGVGLANGIAVALTCGAAVWFWSGSIGLVLVIGISMVLAMVVAGFAGAAVPIALTRMGMDPAQSSSIILTTVTDVAGFFSFLGIASLLAAML